MTAHPEVSVIVISYNDAKRVARAIESVQRQTLRNLEIIVVDDASTDATAAVVAAIAEADPRVRYVCLDENSGGCSAPRNRGMAEARAPWVMFCDSDDEYERHAVKNLLLAAERLDADVVCGCAVRVDVATGRRERWRSELHQDELAAEGLRAFPELLYDTISVNKIYRRALLERHGLAFPVGLLFEDQLFTLQAMALADRVAVIPEDVYYWYVDRQAGEKSITQSRVEIRNVESRMEVNRRIDAFLEAFGDPGLRQVKDIKFLRHDLHLYLVSILDSDDETAQALAVRLADYARTANLEAAWQVRPMTRVALYHLLAGDLDHLRSAMRFLRWGSIVDAPVRMVDGRQFWACEHLAQGPEIAGHSAAEWLDVSSLDLLGVPFSQRRYSHRVTQAQAGDGHLVLRGTTVDYAGDVDADATGICVRLVTAQGRAVAEAPARWSGRHDATLEWETTGPLRRMRPHGLEPADKGAVCVVIQRAGEENATNARGHAAGLQCAAIPCPGGGSVQPTTLEYGGLGWRAVRAAPTAGRAAAWRQRLRPLAVRLGGLLPRSGFVLVDASGGRQPSGRVLAIADALRAEEFGLGQVWVDRAGSIDAPDGVTVVQQGTLRHSWLAARARVRLSDYFPEQTSLRGGLAVATGRAPRVAREGLDDPSVLVDKAAVRQVRARATGCDLALASGPADADALRSAQAFRGEVLLVGLPELPTATGDLGVRTDRPLVIYAPAPRDDGSVDFDADAWAAALGNDCYLVICTPPRTAIDVPNRLRFAIRTTSADAAPFIAAADLVIGDYGPAVPWSVAAGKALLAYLPDESEFVGRQHGTYVDVRTLAPASVSMDALVDEVRAWLAGTDGQEAFFASRAAYRPAWCGETVGSEAARDAARRIVAAAGGGTR